MCVQKKGYDFEGPTQLSDIALLAQQYPDIDFQGLNDAMSKYGFVPVAADLAMIATALTMQADQQGIRYLPFAAIRHSDQAMVKLPVMEGIVGWLENTALGTDMWLSANSWLRQEHSAEVRFTMDCGCCIVPVAHLDNGVWQEWLVKFNQQRQAIYGRTDVVYLQHNSIEDNSMQAHQLSAWLKMRNVLFQMQPRESLEFKEVAA